MSDLIWTPEKRERLLQMHKERGMTYSQIAAALGVTRNSVAGALRRHRCSRLPKPSWHAEALALYPQLSMEEIAARMGVTANHIRKLIKGQYTAYLAREREKREEQRRGLPPPPADPLQPPDWLPGNHRKTYIILARTKGQSYAMNVFRSFAALVHTEETA